MRNDWFGICFVINMNTKLIAIEDTQSVRNSHYSRG